MKRRHLMLGAASAPIISTMAWAHHGWSGFDQERPIYLEGKVLKSVWQNPHVELVIEVAPDFKVPPDLKARALPAQSAPVDGPGLVAKASRPTRKDREWELELAPLTRMDAWKVPEIKPGTQISAVGFTLREEKGEAVMRVEYLFVDGKVYGLRSRPA